jgi:hypothetical protein
MSIQVPLEIEDGLRAEAAARGLSVDSVMREALELYRRQRGNKPMVARRPAFNHRRREIAWTIKPDLDYLGEWVALEGDEVVAHGADGKAVYESARAQGISSPFLFHVSEPDSTPFAGGWLGVE